MEFVYQTLEIENRDGVVIVTINRPAALNALNSLVFSELFHFFSEASFSLVELKGVVLTGAGDKAFVAGADIAELSKLEPGKAKQYLKQGNDVMRLIECFHRPVIAAINGFTLGGGCELAMACHFRIASEKAKFGLPEVNLGILPGYGGTQRLPQLIGKAKALQMMLTGEMITAHEALAMGLIAQVSFHDQVLQSAIELIQKIASKAPLAVAGIISAVNSSYPNLYTGIDHEGEHFNALANTEDFKEGVAAFLEKRKAVFKGS